MAVAKKTAAKPVKPVEPEIDELEELEADEVEPEEMEEIEEDEPAPKPRKAKAERKTPEVTFGIADLARYLSEGREKPVTTRELRTLARKLAKDGSGRVDREIIPGNRARYDWPGIDHPEVQALINAFNSGELEEDKRAKLQALKDKKDAERAAAKAAAGDDTAKPAAKPAAKRAAKKPAPVVEEDDEELDLEEE